MAKKYQIFIGSKQKGENYERYKGALVIAESCAKINKQVFLYLVEDDKLPKIRGKWIDGERVI
jgi:hypothetical protein